MVAYLLAEAKVVDASAYAIYEQLAQVAIRHYGGRQTAAGGRVEVLEGGWSEPQQLVIVEFDSLARAKTFYHSPEYRAARAARQGAAEMNVLVVEGLPI